MSNYINAETAHQVLWFYGRTGQTDDGRVYGYDPGGFKTALFTAIGKADSGNRARLALGFPREVEACNLIERVETGVKSLIGIAVGEYDADAAEQERVGELTES